MASHAHFRGLALPKGWEWSEEQLPDPTICWPDHQLEAVISAEKVSHRRTLFPRFQLFDNATGDWKAIIRTESFDEWLAAFNNAVAQRRQVAAE